jgi:hypothetical protein
MEIKQKENAASGDEAKEGRLVDGCSAQPTVEDGVKGTNYSAVQGKLYPISRLPYLFPHVASHHGN